MLVDASLGNGDQATANAIAREAESSGVRSFMADFTGDYWIKLVLDQCDYLTEIQAWPLSAELNPRAWLDNFTDDERPFAAELLERFIYLSKPLVKRIFRESFRQLSQLHWRESMDANATEASWNEFLVDVTITRVTGETPSDADSGFEFARMARQELSLAEHQIVAPEIALQRLLDGSTNYVVFVDDFVGSGRQFIETWYRKYEINDGPPVSFNAIASEKSGARFCYCAVLCTTYGANKIKDSCKAVILSPGHWLDSRHSAIHADSQIWSPARKTSARQFIEKASQRAGIPTHCVFGFHKLALALAFYYSPPDATLPLFYWNENGWNPLLERA